MEYWSRLPNEIRHMIWVIVAENCTYDPSRPSVRAGYAAVDQQWQRYFEPLIFSAIVVDNDRVHDMNEIITKHPVRRKAVKHIWLKVKLAEYDCGESEVPESAETKKLNEIYLTDTLWNLLSVMAAWRRPRPGLYRGILEEGITLDIAVFSPSDCKHTFRDFRLCPDYPLQSRDPALMDFVVSPAKFLRTHRHSRKTFGLKEPVDDHDCRGWNRVPVLGESIGAIARITGERPLNLDFSDFSFHSERRFPELPVVSQLVLRRQFYRSVAPNVLSKLLDESFTCLTAFSHEQFPDGFGGHNHGIFGTDYVDFLCGHRRRGEIFPAPNLGRTERGSPLPKSLTALIVFQDSDLRLGHRGRAICLDFPNTEAICDSLRCLDLQKIALSHIVSAEGFLADYTIPKLQSGFLHQTISQVSNRCMFVWPELKHIALTSDTFANHPGHLSSVVDLAVKMLIALEFMPKVEIFEIWSENKDNRLVLQFLRAPGGPGCITLLGEQPIGMSVILGVQSALDTVFNNAEGPIPALTVSGGIGRDMLDHHALRCMVLEPISAFQREVERHARRNA
ncbi:uncharacterized protein E0L32_005975 [Thyridium curvatum]|uniref:DUF6546 domain-containing protein n=1 Tax=Thyridium curvatum TaxID=1093900 RepID=A0A507B460_9PEZI|nr:uncharacterized protein E0L32_005975 [Thyridium curvatum]TPX13504.1 hypothetical protein E0L32_005975 [Thyridium curvatum]